MTRATAGSRLAGLLRRRAPSAATALAPADDRAAAVPELWWLTDVPSFIDEQSIARLYNAVVRPDYVLLQASESYGVKRGAGSSRDAEAGGEAALPGLWKVGAKLRAGSSRSEEHAANAQVTKQFVHSAERRLQEVVAAYRDRHPGRLLFESAARTTLRTADGVDADWTAAGGLLDAPGPRPLLFLDFAPGTCILPVVGETVGGCTVLLLDTLVAGLRARGHAVPDFPEDRSADGSAKRLAYWTRVLEMYDNRCAQKAIQDGFGNGERIEWIDFRIQVPSRARPLLCHFSSNGLFPNGMFALSLVRRGYKEGFRLVGQLKKGCDLNILAMYER